MFRKGWKFFWKNTFRSAPAQWLGAFIAFIVIYIVYFTSTKKIVNSQIFRDFKGRAAVFVFWHGRTMMLSPMMRRYNLAGYAVANTNKDGRFMAKLQQLFGLRPIYGSSNDKSVKVLMKGLRCLSQNKWVCLSPDGPEGPSLRLHDGALYFAKMSGAPIIPVCFTSSRPWFQPRWDRYLLALPFSRIICEVGQPFYISKENFDFSRAKLEDFMVSQLRRLDNIFNLPPVAQGLTRKVLKK